MVEGLEKKNILKPGSIIIESSSGNLGVALSLVASQKKYRFICVTDPVASHQNRRLIEIYGGELIVVEQRDENGGFLATRIRLIQKMCEDNKDCVWVNQYANEDNWRAHYTTTAYEIDSSISNIDWLFVGAGTTGTAMGCARYFRHHSPGTQVIAVDAEGSVTFGGPPQKRRIPGLGTSRRPEIVDQSYFDKIVMVPEVDTIRMCRKMARNGLLFGGSTGTVLAGIERADLPIQKDQLVVAISPDNGERYLDTIYDDDWVKKEFPMLTLPLNGEYDDR